MTWTIDAPALRPHGSQFIRLANGTILKGGCTIIAFAGANLLSKAASAPASVWKLPGAVGDLASATNVQALMRAVYEDALAHGNCQANGAARQVDMLNEAKRVGLPVKDVLYLQSNAAPLAYATWVAFVRKYKGYPLLWQFANGQALNDALGGGSDEVGLRVHATLSYGTQTDAANPSAGGYLFLDGDSPVANQRPSVYNLATLAKAQPISIIAFDYIAAPKPVPPPAPKPTPTPAPQPAPSPNPDAALKAALQSIITTATAAERLIP